MAPAGEGVEYRVRALGPAIALIVNGTVAWPIDAPTARWRRFSAGWRTSSWSSCSGGGSTRSTAYGRSSQASSPPS